MFICYEIKSSATHKKYIGITGRSASTRIAQHFRDAMSGSRLLLHRAIRKYGKETFSISVIRECETREEAARLEVELIEKLGTLNPGGYNMTTGGEGVVELCADGKRRKSESVKARHRDPEYKARHLAGVIRSRTPEFREKMSKAHKGKPMHPNAAKAILEAKKTPEYREIAREAAKKTWSKPGYKDDWVKAKLAKHIQKAARFPMRDDGLIFSSTRSAARYMAAEGWEKAAPNNISLACSGRYKTSCGHAWSWIDGDQARLVGGIIE